MSGERPRVLVLGVGEAARAALAGLEVSLVETLDPPPAAIVVAASSYTTAQADWRARGVTAPALVVDAVHADARMRAAFRTAEEALRVHKEQLEVTNKRLEENLDELRKSRAVSAQTLASYQQRALQMEVIRQQNEDLDRLAQELGRAKKIEEARAPEIEASARLKSAFLADFSHEIRTPLNGLLGYCELLIRDEGQRLTPHGRRDLSVIKSNANTLLALINDILDLSKIESGHVDVVVERFSLANLVDECIATVREYVRGKPVELYAQLDSEVVEVETDKLKLRQILLNLLSNAAKITESGEVID